MYSRDNHDCLSIPIFNRNDYQSPFFLLGAYNGGSDDVVMFRIEISMHVERIKALQEQSQAILAESPKLRIKNVADKLGVPERDLVQAQCCGVSSRYLGDQPKALFKRLGELGRVMAITRNPWCVHERHGQYEKIAAGEQAKVGVVLGPDIDLRMFFSRWGTVWAVQQGDNLSIQFFDTAGVAFHKVYATAETDKTAFEAFIQAHLCDQPVPNIVPTPESEPLTGEAGPAFREDWLAMTDPHEFAPLLHKWALPRVKALAAAGADLAQPVATDAVETMLTQVAEQGIPIMCFVGNQSMVQIHKGSVKKLLRMGPWYNVLDPDFNLHLNTEAVHSAWVVVKPTESGTVTSLELYEEGGRVIAQFFGMRQPGTPELNPWRAVLQGLCASPLYQKETACA